MPDYNADEIDRLVRDWRDDPTGDPAVIEPILAALSAAKAEVERMTKIGDIHLGVIAGDSSARDNLRDQLVAMEADRDRLAAEVERLTKERDAAMREADRLRHGVGIEGDFVCPNELENTRLAARVRELELTEEEREFIAVIADELTYRGWRKDEDGAVALEVLDRLAKGGR